ncbi:MAG: prephenate dehydratase [Saprospiraceae bacterium]|nr:prephenate dehydratase [Saprospiraceae bacterium]
MIQIETTESAVVEADTPPLRAVIQGVAGAFHEVAARRYFGDAALEIVPALSFGELVQTLEAGAGADVALMAIENTLAGSLMSNYRLLHEADLVITGELHLRIAQHLMALPGQSIADIREVHSHPIALAQCRAFFREYPHLRLIETEDTALSARLIAENRQMGAAAVAGALAADMYGLEILAESIETNKRNHTRFLVLQRREDAVELQDADKVSMSFSTEHEVGSLYKVLAVLAAYNVNLTKIQSAPIIGQPWEYLFFVDFVTEGKVRWQQAIDAIRPLTHGLRVFGAYRQGVHYE